MGETACRYVRHLDNPGGDGDNGRLLTLVCGVPDWNFLREDEDADKDARATMNASRIHRLFDTPLSLPQC